MEEGLKHISSREISEWAAYERFAGPINSRWQDEILGMIHELIQQEMRLLGAAHFTDRKRKKNPVPEVRHVPRPWELDKDREVPVDDPTDNISDDYWDDEEDDEDGG